MAAAHELQKKGKKARYVRAETFTAHVVSAIRSGNMKKFREAYRHVDTLLVDDVHIFAKKAATQEEFFHTFNALHMSRCQLFFTADCSPQQLEEIEPRLVSRFEWGIILSLEKLTLEEMEQVARKRCAFFDLPVSDEILSFLVKTFGSNTKTLIRAIEALVLRCKENRSSSLKLIEVESLLKDLIEEETQTALTPQKILQSVSHFYGIPVTDILGKSQSHDCVLPRQIAMYLCRRELQIPFLKIGSLFSRDHSTVMSSVKLVETKLTSLDKELSSAICEILKKSDPKF
jgi:chromosomal replication initiator protein